MRAVSLEERNKRGCLYCTDFKKAKSNAPTTSLTGTKTMRISLIRRAVS